MSALATSLTPNFQPNTDFYDIPADVRLGSALHFLYTCANHGLSAGTSKTLQHRGEIVLVLNRTPSLDLVRMMNCAEHWIKRKTAANASERRVRKLNQMQRSRKSRTLQKPPSWTGVADPTKTDPP